MFIVDVLKCFTKIMRILIPISTDGFMTRFLIQSNNCHEIAYKHFYTSRICILNAISLTTQSTYFPHKNPEMPINISIYIWHLRAFDGLFTVKRKWRRKSSFQRRRRPVKSPPRTGGTSNVNQFHHSGAFLPSSYYQTLGFFSRFLFCLVGTLLQWRRLLAFF